MSGKWVCMTGPGACDRCVRLVALRSYFVWCWRNQATSAQGVHVDEGSGAAGTYNCTCTCRCLLTRRTRAVVVSDVTSRMTYLGIKFSPNVSRALAQQKTYNLLYAALLRSKQQNSHKQHTILPLHLQSHVVWSKRDLSKEFNKKSVYWKHPNTITYNYVYHPLTSIYNVAPNTQQRSTRSTVQKHGDVLAWMATAH